MMIAISFSRWGTEVPNRTKAPRRWTRSQSSGLRRSALKGPRRPAPRGPDWIASATRFWSAVIVSGVSVVNLGSLIAFLPDSRHGPRATARPLVHRRIVADVCLVGTGSAPTCEVATAAYTLSARPLRGDRATHRRTMHQAALRHLVVLHRPMLEHA